MLKNYEIITDDEISGDKVVIGVTVTIKDANSKEQFTYAIVGSAEADPISGKISDESPVGKALIGHKVKETVEVELPDGKALYKIVDIKK